MKATELMVGDFVTFRDCLEDDAIIKVEIKELHAYDNTILVSIDNDPTFDTIDLDDEVVGIPLTPKILEKNGFDVSDPEVSIYRFEEDEQVFRFCLRRMYNKEDNRPNGYSFYAFNVLAIIDSVHQLQHALRLCGIEKEIEP